MAAKKALNKPPASDKEESPPWADSDDEVETVSDLAHEEPSSKKKKTSASAKEAAAAAIVSAPELSNEQKALEKRMIRLMGLPKSMGQAASRNAKFPTKSTVGPLKENGEQLQLLALGKLHSRLYLETNLASGYMTYNVKMDVAGLARTEGKDSLTKFKTWCEEKSGNPLVRFTDGNVDTLTFQKKYSEYTSLELLEQKFFTNVYDASEVDKLGDAPKLTDYSLLEKDAVAAVSFVPRFYVREGHEGVMLSLVAIFYLGKDVTSGASYEHTPRAVTSFDD